MAPLTPLPLGISLPPEDTHALSVSMPDWSHVVGYEEGRPEVLGAMACGYPRFFRHPLVVELATLVQTRVFPEDDPHVWELMVTPTAAVAERLRLFLVASNAESGANGDVTVHVIKQAIHVVRFPRRFGHTAKSFWQHSGEIVSSRHAQRLLHLLRSDEDVAIPAVRETEKHLALKKRVAGLYLPSEDAANVALYPTGMGAIFSIVRLLQKFRGKNCKSILVGFPYVDTLKILARKEWCPEGVHFFPNCGEEELKQVEEIVAKEKVLGIFTEFPGNPLLSMPDLNRLAKSAHDNGTVLVVDDTVGSYNVNTMKHGCADLVATSLSKIFSGTGNVMGGSVVLNPEGPKFKELEAIFDPEDSFIIEDDVEALLEQSENLAERLAKTNATTADIVQRLLKHPLVKEVFYPMLGDAANLYDPFLNPLEGKNTPRYGPLFSILLPGGLEPAKAFYNTINVAKGPSLGTNFTLCCPYTLLAHYGELDFVESCGVDRDLIRISIGQEDPEVIWADLEKAFAAAGAFATPDAAASK
jgi:cystathionine gamma-synthase